MYHAISGAVTHRTPGTIVIGAGGLEYEIQVSLLTYEAIGEGSDHTRLLLRQVVTESSVTLYGFATSAERDLFEHLLGVNGVGAKLALKLLSGYPAPDLAAIIAAGDIPSIMRVKGVGRKKAEFIVTTLRNSLGQLGQHGAGASLGSISVGGGPTSDAILALVKLGYKHAEAEKSVARAAKALDEDASLETLILEALRAL